MTGSTSATSDWLHLVRCACGGALREVDAYGPPDGLVLVHQAACNRCGSRFDAEQAARAVEDALRSGVPVELNPRAA